MDERIMRFHERRQDNVAIYSLDGNIIDNAGTGHLKENVQSALADGVQFIILDLLNVDFVNSTGLGGFLNLYTLIQRQRGKLYLVHASTHVKDILRITQADTIFSVCESVEEAIKDISSSQKPAS